MVKGSDLFGTYNFKIKLQLVKNVLDNRAVQCYGFKGKKKWAPEYTGLLSATI